jgi:DNA adenine methylase
MFRQRVYNDVNDDLVNMWRELRDNPEELARLIWATPYARAEMQACFSHEPCTDLERARRMIVRGNQSMAPTRSQNPGSSFAVGKSGSLEHKWQTMPETIMHIASKMRDVCIEHTSAETLFPRYDSPDTVWYLDPPYTSRQRVQKKEYHTELTDLDHFKLARIAASLQGSVFVSGYAGELYANVYKDWNKAEWESHAFNNMNHHSGGAKRTEVLWYKYSASVLSQQAMAL